MGFYADVVLPYCIEWSCGTKALVPERQRVATRAHGTLLEIGFGSGLNLPHLPASVRRVLAVDPSVPAQRLGKERIAASRAPVEFIGLDAERIQAADASADSALCTFTLCTIPDAVSALREVRRILKPGGELLFLEHGRAPDPGVARWQARLNPAQRLIAGGCNLDRDIPALLRAAGFEVRALESRYFPGVPRTHGFLYSGAAIA